MEITLNDVPKYLHQSQYYLNLLENCNNSDVKFYCLHCKENNIINNNIDFIDLINTLDFWVSPLSFDLFMYTFNNKKIVKDL